MISVVIPLYNKEQSIAATLQSVLAQTYTDFEVIVVDDGSTDNSLSVIRGKVRELERKQIKIIHQENEGVSAARNRGIIEAQGEYIAFLDADDLWAPDYLETLMLLIKDYPNAGLYSIGYEEIDANIIPSTCRSYEKHVRGVVEHPWSARIGVWTGSVAANRGRMIKVGLFDTRMTYGEDLDMWWRLILDGGLVNDNICCAYYRQDAENRAMNKTIPLEKYIPYYMDKYAEARANNVEFRRFFDCEMIYRLYPYLFDKRCRAEAQRIASQFDYSLQKKSMKWRMKWPYIYRIYQKVKNKKWIRKNLLKYL